MDACLTDQDLGLYVDGSASPEQMSAWNEHVDTCASCAERLTTAHAALTQDREATDADATMQYASHGRLGPGVQLGDFRIEKQLGAGGMGVVYQARQVSLNRQVALKVLPPGLGMTSSARVRFHREAQAAAKLHHTHIVAVHAEGEHEGICYFAMELIEGRSLDRVIDELRGPEPKVLAGGETVTVQPGGSQPAEGTRSGSGLSGSGSRSDRGHFDTIARWIADVADALDYAHNQGVIHRDVKPSNLMLGNDGRLSLMDFGLARMLEQPGMTISGEFLGTPRYMSPEQIAVGRMKLDHRTDIYSLGATLYELLTLQPPFPGEHRDEIIGAIMTKEPHRPRQIDKRIPVDLETICLKAIEKDPDRRYATGGALAEDLRRYVHRKALVAKRVGPLGRSARFVRRNKLSVVAAAILMAMVSVAAISVSRSQRAEQAARTEQQQRETSERMAEAERLLWAAQGLHHEGRYADALARIEACLERDPTRLEAQLLHARLLFERGQVDTAVQEVESLLAEELPQADAGAAHYLLAAIFQGRDPDEAENHLQRAEQLLPDSAEAFYLRAMITAAYDEKERWLEQALNADPSHYPSLRARTLLYYASNDFPNMEREADRLLTLRPKDASIWSLRAIARREAGRLDEALADHQRAVDLAPDDPEVYDERRKTHHRRGRYRAELADARRCVELSPEEFWYRTHVFTALLSMSDFQAAEREHDAIVVAHPQRRPQLRTVGWKHAFDTLAAGRPLHVEDTEATTSEAAKRLRRWADTYRVLTAKARRVVAGGSGASWGPEGRHLAYSKGLPGSNALAVVEIESGRTRVIAMPGTDASWSPNGRYIAFVRERQTPASTQAAAGRLPTRPERDAEIWVVTPQGNGLRRLAKGAFPTWSADSKHVYYFSPPGQLIFSIAVDDPGTVPQRVMALSGDFPAVSPDARHVAYVRDRHVVIAKMPSGDVVATWTGIGWLASRLAWSPDSRELSFPHYHHGLWVFEMETRTPWNILDGLLAHPAWSPDRSGFAFDAKGTDEIWIADLNPKVPTTQSMAPARSLDDHLRQAYREYVKPVVANPEAERERWQAFRHYAQSEFESAGAAYLRAVRIDSAILGPMPRNNAKLFVQRMPARIPDGTLRFVLSGGPDPATPLIVNDDLELDVDGKLVFRDSAQGWTFRHEQGVTWGGQPIPLLARPGSLIHARVLNTGAATVGIGDVYIHHPRLGSRRLLKGREQDSGVFLDRLEFDFDLAKVYASPSD